MGDKHCVALLLHLYTDVMPFSFFSGGFSRGGAEGLGSEQQSLDPTASVRLPGYRTGLPGETADCFLLRG